jgi:hypothetical protein
MENSLLYYLSKAQNKHEKRRIKRGLRGWLGTAQQQR